MWECSFGLLDHSLFNSASYDMKAGAKIYSSKYNRSIETAIGACKPHVMDVTRRVSVPCLQQSNDGSSSAHPGAPATASCPNISNFPFSKSAAVHVCIHCMRLQSGWQQ